MPALGHVAAQAVEVECNVRPIGDVQLPTDTPIPEVGVRSFFGCLFEQVEVAVDSPWDGQWGGAGEVAQWGFIA